MGLVLEASPTTLGGDTRNSWHCRVGRLAFEDPVDPDFARSFVADTSSDRIAPEFLDQLVREV